MINRNTITEAHERIRPFIHRTPLMTSTWLEGQTGARLFFKCENFQKIGAFKARGATNAVQSLPLDERRNGVAAHSSGNHAQALALAAQVTGIPSFIVMPANAPQIKKNAVRGYGGQVFECEPTIQAREAMLEEVVRKTGATEIHPFNNEAVIAGQATAALELLEDAPALDIIIAPVGGGGLLSGTALAASYFFPATTVIAAEPEGADDACRSMQSGKIEPSQSASIADGLLTSLSERTFAIIREHVKDIITVSDAEIVGAMRILWERMKIIVEPSGAVALAAVIKAKERFLGKSVGIILTGGNVDLKKALMLFEGKA
ncbi:MAG TPA: pyridoxal-phosphate dependent enzyme [Ohtaekwangia sp.]|nr:pyridoxal-phosphate dependent enzyme [Ohtaekwangia sp.]